MRPCVGPRPWVLRHQRQQRQQRQCRSFFTRTSTQSREQSTCSRGPIHTRLASAVTGVKCLSPRAASVPTTAPPTSVVDHSRGVGRVGRVTEWRATEAERATVICWLPNRRQRAVGRRHCGIFRCMLLTWGRSLAIAESIALPTQSRSEPLSPGLPASPSLQLCVLMSASVGALLGAQ